MNAIPMHTARLVAKLLGAYCERVCPPTARHTVRLRYELRRDRATLFEVRRFCGVPGADQSIAVAEFRYAAGAAEWRLFHADIPAAAPPAGLTVRWRRYPQLARGRGFLELLRVFDADPAGRFWSRINGRSLRWCSATGRCDGCDDRYCRILGLDPDAADLQPRPVTRLLRG